MQIFNWDILKNYNFDSRQVVKHHSQKTQRYRRNEFELEVRRLGRIIMKTIM